MPENKPFRIGFLIFIFFLLLLILKHSFYLRSIGYDQIPETFVILDERTWVWQGLSIRESGVPAAWSNLGMYKLGTGGDVNGLNLIPNQYASPNILHFRDYPKPVYVLYLIDLGEKAGLKHISLVQPLIEQPPLGGLILSSLVSGQVKTFSDLKPTDFRRASLWLGLISGILIFILGWQIFNNPALGLLATAIYGTVPTFNLLSRYALLENVLNPFMLATINLLVLTQRLNIPKNLLVLAGIVSGLAALTKITGWFVLVLGIALLLYWRIKMRELLFFIIPAVIIGSLYFVWVLYLAPNLFFDVVGYQSIERGFIGSINFLVTATRVGILNFPLDGWWIGGFLSLMLISFKKEYAPVFFGAIIMLLSALFLGGANYPWYFIPLIPFMCLSIALFIWQVATNPKFISILIFFLVFLSSTFYWGYGVFQAALPSTNYQQPYFLYRILLIFFILSGIVLSIQSKFKKLNRLWFVFMIILILIILRFNERSLYFILSNWGKLPSIYTPGTF